MSVATPPPLSETVIIKAVYTNVENLVNVASSLDVRDFSHKPYRILYSVIRKLAASNTVVNADSILAWLESKAPNNYRDILDAGGAILLDTLYDSAYRTLTNLDEHVRLITESADSKVVVDASNKMQAQIVNGQSYESALGEFEQTVNSVRLRGKTSDVKPIGHSLQKLREQLVNQDDSVVGISIERKYPKLNKMLKNLQPNRLTVILSNYKTGKSSLMLDIAWYVAHDLGVAVAFGDSEMYEAEFQLRLLAKVTGWPYDYIQSGLWKGSAEHTAYIDAAIAKIERTPFYWVNVNHMERQQITALVKLTQLKHHIGLFVYDYIKADLDSLDGRIDKQVERKVDMLKEDIAKTCNIHVLSAVQLNDSTGKATDSKGVYRLADSVVTLRRVTQEDEGYGLASHIMILDTSRNSEQGQRALVDIDFATQRIREIR